MLTASVVRSTHIVVEQYPQQGVLILPDLQGKWVTFSPVTKKLEMVNPGQDKEGLVHSPNTSQNEKSNLNDAQPLAT